MLQTELRRFAPLYQTARYLAADQVLRRHLGLDADCVLPVGLSHGVDFGQMFGIMDAHGVEPLYWAYNTELLKRAEAVKPAVGLPHPFLFAARDIRAVESRGRLVVGPPPGPEHDRELCEILRDESAATTILVKRKRNHERSTAFWRDHGFETTTLADAGAPTYDNMARLFSRFETVAGSTFSSALFFAAALGKPVDLIRGLRCRAWEVPGIEEVFDFKSARARDVGRIMAGGDHQAKIDLSRRLLGEDLEKTPEAMKGHLEAAIAALKEPLHFAPGYPPLLRKLVSAAALRLNKPGLIMRRPSDLAVLLRKREIVLQDLDDVALWVEGCTDDNPRLSLHPYVRGRTVPGDAVEAY